MKFTATIVALAGVVAANKNVTYVTEVVTALTTYCPAPTTIVHSDKTYTITKPTTFTITDCPCTITRPVTTSSVVVCHSCGYNATSTKAPVPTTSAPPVVTAGAAKVAGAGLAGILGLAAFVL